MHTSSIGIRKTYKIDTSLLPQKFVVTTNNATPLEVYRLNLGPDKAGLATLKAVVKDLGLSGNKASFVINVRLRNDGGLAFIDDGSNTDNHTFRTDSGINLYFDTDGNDHVLYAKGILQPLEWTISLAFV